MEVIPKKARDKARGSLREIAVNGISTPKGDTGIVVVCSFNFNPFFIMWAKISKSEK